MTRNLSPLITDDCLRPNPETPAELIVKQSSDAQYVPGLVCLSLPLHFPAPSNPPPPCTPDVFFTQKDEYGNETKQAALPTFPVEYLIVGLEAGTKIEPPAKAPLIGPRVPFVIENRAALGAIQDIAALNRHFSQSEPFLRLV